VTISVSNSKVLVLLCFWSWLRSYVQLGVSVCSGCTNTCRPESTVYIHRFIVMDCFGEIKLGCCSFGQWGHKQPAVWSNAVPLATERTSFQNGTEIGNSTHVHQNFLLSPYTDVKMFARDCSVSYLLLISFLCCFV